jgi:hypothetical protein
METLNKENIPSTQLDTKTELTDADIYGAEVPEVVLAQRQLEQERNEENLGIHAENIVYATEIVNFADTLLQGSDNFSHNEATQKNGVDKFNFGSFDIKRTSTVEGRQDYAISLIKMGSREPQRVDYAIAIRNGHVRIDTYHENAPSKESHKPQALDRDIAWTTDQVMDPNDLVKSAGEKETSRQLGYVLDFMEQHSQDERDEREKHETKAARKRGSGALRHFAHH